MHLRGKHKIHQTETTTRGKEISAQELQKHCLGTQRVKTVKNVVNILNAKGKESYKQNKEVRRL